MAGSKQYLAGWDSAAPGVPGRFWKEAHQNHRGGVHGLHKHGVVILHIWTTTIFPPELFCPSTGQRSSKTDPFFSLKIPMVQTTGRVQSSLVTFAAKQRSCFKPCNPTSQGHFWESQLRYQRFLCCSDGELWLLPLKAGCCWN